MGLLSSIISAPFGELIGKVGTIIDSLHTSQEEKLNLEMARLQIVLAAQQAERELQAKVEENYMKDLANLREQAKVELQSDDPFVRRSRPAFNWIIYSVIVFNYIALPMVQYVTGNAPAPIELPYELWMVFGGGFLGYAYLRTKEKTNK